MKWYSADIGTYERGKVIRFQAHHSDALRLASSQGNVVQLRVGAKPKGKDANDGLGNVVYDEFNGFYDDRLL